MGAKIFLASSCLVRAPAAAVTAAQIENFCEKIFKKFRNGEAMAMYHPLEQPYPSSTHQSFLNFCLFFGSISFGQLSGYIVCCILLIGGASPPL